jgi:alpha-tubulin suppressor-like RCC1 family protein
MLEEGHAKPTRMAWGDAVEIAAGHTHACALRRDGAVLCWGEGGGGALGSAARVSIVVPVEAMPSEGGT